MGTVTSTTDPRPSRDTAVPRWPGASHAGARCRSPGAAATRWSASAAVLIFVDRLLLQRRTRESPPHDFGLDYNQRQLRNLTGQTRHMEIATITSDIFLELVNEALVGVDRKPLPAEGVEQRIVAVTPGDRVLQILAGPGAGKTEWLVWRVLFELFVNAIPSRRVLVTTFTRRAAADIELRLVERAEALQRAAQRRGIGIPDVRPHDLRIGTIHSLCDELLSEFNTKYLESGTQLVDEVEIATRLARDDRYALGYTGALMAHADSTASYRTRR